MSTLLRFNKPFGVLCQFTTDGAHPTLASFIKVPDVYPAGRLDTDSEGLLLLTDHGPWQARIADPQHRLVKTYWAQVEGIPDGAALHALRQGVTLGDFTTRPAQARLIDEPAHLWPRTPPIRYRAHIPTSWLELQLTEGKNRQVRRMTAAVGHPTLRLIRAAIGPWTLDGLEPGQWEDIAWPAGVLSSAANDSPAAEPRPQKQKTGMRSPQPRHHRSRTTSRT